MLIHFSNSAEESTTSTMKKEDLSTNGFDLNKSNIIKPTLYNLLEEDRKVLEDYHKEVDEMFLPRYDVTRQGFVKRDDVLVTIRKSEVTPKVKSDPWLSLDDVQVMINSTLERSVKSSNEMMCRLIEERNGKKFVDPNIHASSSSSSSSRGLTKIVSPRLRIAARKNYTGTVLCKIRPRVEHQSQKELSHISNGPLHSLKRLTV
jgi:hypothetical protein